MARPTTVLVAEDERDAREAISRALGRVGCQCDHAADGEAAIHLLTARHYDLLWLDHVMPKVNGTAVLAFARGTGVQAPAVLCSGLATIEDQWRAAELGRVLYLPKPFEMKVVPRVLRAALGRDGTPVEQAYRQVLALSPTHAARHETCLGILLCLLTEDLDLARCAVIADAVKALASRRAGEPLSYTREVLERVMTEPPASPLTRLLTLIDTLNLDDVATLAKAAGVSEGEVRHTLHIARDVDIRHWVRLRRVRWTLRYLRQGMKVAAAGEDAGFRGGAAQATKAMQEVLGITSSHGCIDRARHHVMTTSADDTSA